MTGQISDSFDYRNQPYSLVGIRGVGLFDPAQHGIKPVAISTACWRGFFCIYEVADNALFLTTLYIGLGNEDEATAVRGEGPKLFGKVPSRYPLPKLKWMPNHESSDFKVDGIRELIPFTGGLLLGKDFIQDMYVHGGYQRAYKFREVHEMVFDSGRLVEEHDRSAQMSELREMILSEDREHDLVNPRSPIQKWIKQHFSRQYEF
ncbi:hypothetical protein [Trichocoleus sp. FACHB-262]|uniref:hypothetical protein n=1 Tax=Trichocoleus sp. FACHB-262 TaxID=2692869 RepID=UPI0018F042D4|nr:hypothetical protein [Trichocoleus sp. FACHB-262]